ncbi:MAG: L-histidine N(alpha)-methyltransferase [Pseudomonadota bacterium]
MDGTFQGGAFPDTQEALLEDAIAGLSQTQKALSPKWLYDARGSQLFEQITTLPEYYPTRVETSILRCYSNALAGLVPKGGALVELGSGASVKTRILLDKGQHLGAYVPLDISEQFLQQTAEGLRDMYPTIAIAPIVADFIGHVEFPSALRSVPKVGFFPGSTIGNLEPPLARDLLARAAQWPNVTGFILGVDLVKEEKVLVDAYDDAQGITAEFIKNSLGRLNKDLDADFNLDHFGYRAEWNSALAQIDMSLVSLCDQAAHLCGHRIKFLKNETIHVSASRKYTAESLKSLVGPTGWKIDKTFTDPAERFAVVVLERAAPR